MSSIDVFGSILGYLATLCFTIQYVPQLLSNYRRRSVEGLSLTCYVIKLIGAYFLFVVALISGEHPSVICYGMVNLIQYNLFMFFWFRFRHVHWVAWTALTPMAPLVLVYLWPEVGNYTIFLKPLSQVFSHIPQLMLVYKAKTTNGVSMKTQGLCFMGGLCGFIMTLLVPPKSFGVTAAYICAMGQGGTLVAARVYYGDHPRLGARGV
ncbi:PQ loop repeat [Carpediemonas membranifera]|uniref:PQ loop repeat n=1 Tax=Carpediemonas membranifera TaxID=201153 RepID=A0A8J6AZ24_9EUKA|nr:PQ loop repeat [Carpediemonas membranifera]|eukprot:KAG9395840.1 PQ loop repeat [Carpediemonas membranifera]